MSNVLSINDLWKVYEYDEKWCHLQNRKKKVCTFGPALLVFGILTSCFQLVDLMKRMQYYQTESLQTYRRPLSDSHINELV